MNRIPLILGLLLVGIARAGAQQPKNSTDTSCARLDSLRDTAAVDNLPPYDATRLFLAPTGRTLQECARIFGAYQLFFPFMSYAFTDWFMVSGGTPLWLGESTGRLWYFAPKLRLFKGQDARVAVGGLFMVNVAGLIGLDEGGFATPTIWAVSTYGEPDAAISLGVATAPTTEPVLDELILFGGIELLLVRRPSLWSGGPGYVKLIVETYALNPLSFDGYAGNRFSAAGLKFVDRKLSVEVVMAAEFASSEINFFSIPLVSFSFQF